MMASITDFELRISRHARVRWRQRTWVEEADLDTLARKAWLRGRPYGLRDYNVRKRRFADLVWVFAIDRDEGIVTLVTIIDKAKNRYSKRRRRR